MDAPGCVFLLGLDQEVIARGIEIKYRELKQAGDGQTPRFVIDGAHYLEKIIQLPFQIPPVERADMGEFVSGLSAEWPHEECPNVFAEGLGDNPRQIKRTVNVFLMLWKLAGKREHKLQGRIKPLRLAKVVAIQTIYPELYALLKETPRYLRELEEYYRAESPSPSGGGVRGEGEGAPARKSHLKETTDDNTLYITDDPAARADLPPALASYVSRQAVRRILTLHPPDMPDANFSGLTPDELRLYFTLTRRAEAPQAAPAEAPRQAFEPQMVRIPAGKFLMGSTPEQAQKVLKETNNDKDWQKWLVWEQPQHEVELSEYAIGKYPVTNREYQAFVKETGHSAPQGWDDSQYPAEKGDHPAVNVSWDDAQEYCNWLSKKAGKNYRLPTEAEWEKAARWQPSPAGGGQGEGVSLIYPWGDEFDPQKANTSETNIGGTSPVGQFSPQGDSPYGCADMAGNVWEWCADWFAEQAYKSRKPGIEDPQGPENGTYRALRGGSFLNGSGLARCAFRFRNSPDLRSRGGGFRVVVSRVSL